MGLEEAVTRARKEWHHKHGKCTMCTVGDEPKNGLHVGKHKCGNENACLLCHNAEVQNKGVALHTDALIAQHGLAIYQQAVLLRQMPLNNATGITEAERLVIRRWFDAGMPRH